MSVGEVCPCDRPEHPERGASMAHVPGRCPHQSADQELGGYCSSCASGWHRPCGRTFTTRIGMCTDCGWHASTHEYAA